MSTTHAILELFEEMTNCLENNKYSIGAFIDLKKALDTVGLDVLPKKKKIPWSSWYSTYVDCELFRK